MDAAETAVAHADNLIAGLCGGFDLRHQRINVGGHTGPRAHGRQRFCRIPIQTGGMTKRQIGLLQTPRQLRFHGAEFHGVAARLKHRQDAGLADAPAQAIQGGANRRRVMGEIVKHLNGLNTAAYAAAQFHAASHILKTRQCRARLRRRDAYMRGCGYGCECIHLVMHASQIPTNLRHRLAGL